MSKTQIKYYANDANGKAYTATYSNVNPETSDETLLEFTSKIHSLSSDTYTQTEKIVTTNLDTSIDTRTIPTLTADKTEITMSSQTATITASYDGDGTLYWYRENGLNGFLTGSSSTEDNKIIVYKYGTSSESGTLIITATETKRYQKPEPLRIKINKV